MVNVLHMIVHKTYLLFSSAAHTTQKELSPTKTGSALYKAGLSGGPKQPWQWAGSGSHCLSYAIEAWGPPPLLFGICSRKQSKKNWD